MQSRQVGVSVVSHRQAGLCKDLVEDLAKLPDWLVIGDVVLTLNVPEALPFDPERFPFRVAVVRNDRPKGFAANHNSAFAVCGRAEHFLVLNPDIRIQGPILAPLLALMDAHDNIGVATPRVVDPSGIEQDNARRVPSPLSIARRALAGGGVRPEYPSNRGVLDVEWLAGMFMLFRSSAFSAVGGFDSRYFLYYEDVDICCRLRLAGYRVIFDPAVTVTHDARRASHRRLSHFGQHVASMYRFFSSATFRAVRSSKWGSFSEGTE